VIPVTQFYVQDSPYVLSFHAPTKNIN